MMARVASAGWELVVGTCTLAAQHVEVLYALCRALLPRCVVPALAELAGQSGAGRALTCAA